MPPLAWDLDLTIGALEIALSVSAFLVGCATVQAYIYYRSFPNDRLFMKLLVAAIWLIEFVSHITSAQSVYKYSVTEWGKPLGLLKQSKALVATVYLSAIIAPTVETFYLYRIYRFAGSRSLYIVALGALAVWVRYGGWVFLSIEVDKLGVVDGRFLDQWSWLLILQLSVGAGMDTVISMTIVYFLWKKGNTGIARTTLIMHRIVRWTIQTGLIASAAFLTTLTTFVTRRDTLIWLGMLATLSKVFSNCFFASLNARRAIQNLPSASQVANIPLSSWGDTWQTHPPINEHTFTNRSFRVPEGPVIDIHISKEVHHTPSP